MWHDKIGILPETLKVYGTIDEPSILNSLRIIGMANTPKRLFEYPFGFANDLRNFLFGRSIRMKNSAAHGIRVTFCPCCIEKNIKKLGFAYFKIHWFNNTYCTVHHSPLYELKTSFYSRAKAIKAIDIILRGKIPQDASIITQHNDLKVIQQNNVNNHFAGCFTRELNKKFPWPVNFDDNSWDMSSDEIAEIQDNFEYLHKRYPYTLERIFKNKAKVIDVLLGVFNRNAISGKVIKLRSSSCQICTNYNCILNLTIKRPTPSSQLADLCTQNQFALLDSLGASPRYRNKNLEEKAAHMSLEDKIKVVGTKGEERLQLEKKWSIELEEKFLFRGWFDESLM
ncbi:hypothetical protein RI845_00940 [Thalassotalea nanhaiensis]|uniref:Transposon Tn7 transposition protein TnsD C-termianl domain-containing protein n=1 Tax=Thalassotalea nanhaiensis TaxID=3065648 RepID=A0ABY9TKE8_9GAMM|nr:hypothetical protein RI845_00940 [Colwelliaceae bacterium SQ345]